jgi:hypothetical protein
MAAQFTATKGPSARRPPARLRGRHAGELVAGGVEGRRCADQFVPVAARGRRRHGRHRHQRRRGFGDAPEVARLQVAQVLGDVAPGGGVAADHPADAGAHRAAFDLAEHHQLPEQAGDIAGGVADLRPAGRLGAQAVGRDVLIVLAAVLPHEFALVGAAVDVEVEGHRRHLDDPFERMQLGAGHEDGCRVTLGPALAHQLRVARARHIAGAREQAAGAVDAQRVDQLAAQVAHGRAVPQQHALVVQPDAAVAGREEQRLGEVGQRGRLAVVEVGAVAAPQHRAGLAGDFGEGDARGFGHAGQLLN